MRVLGAVVLAAASAVAACASGTAADFSLDATGGVAYPRTLQAERQVELQFTADADADAVITSATLSSPYFAATDAAEQNVRVFAGHIARVRVPLGDAVCPPGSGVTVVDIEVDVDGVLTESRVALAVDVLAKINATECARQAVTDVAEPTFGDALTASATEVRTTIVFTRGSSAAPVTVVEVRGNIIFTLVPDAGALPVELESDARSLEIPVTIVASRCDPHAFAESKKTFVFPAWVSVDGAQLEYVEFQPGAVVRDALQELFDACGTHG